MGAPEFCETLLREGRAMIFPGTLFGDEDERYIRIGYVQPLEQIQEAVARMEQVIAAHRVPA